MKIISLKQEECFISVIKIHGFVWSFGVLITNILAIIYTLCFDYVINSVPIPNLKRHR